MTARINLIFLALTTLSGCAGNPDKMNAQYVSPLKYQAYDCEQIGMEIGNVERRTGIIYQNLKSEATADAWQMGVGLVLFWPILFALEGGTSPVASEYTQLKGDHKALQSISVQKKCGLDIPSLEEVIKNSQPEKKAIKKMGPRNK